MDTRRSFRDADRYLFDFRLCTLDGGWAQLDSRQDASYFGNWLNPGQRKLVGYAEGDVTVTSCDSDAEFVAEVERTCRWYEEHDGKRPGIDPGFSDSLRAAFVGLGLGGWLH